MVCFHFCFDLTYFQLAGFDFYNDPFWIYSRIVILSAFLVLVGASLWLSHESGIDFKKAWRRVLVIVANAALVSVATYAMFGGRWIFFGVLHFIAIASILGLPLVRHRLLALGVGCVCLWAGSLSNAIFDQPWLRWVGFMTHKPGTEDYVPLMPWFGVVATGIFLGPLLKHVSVAWNPRSSGWRLAAGAGRHTLLVYMVHQPILIGLLKLYLTAARS